MPRLPKPTAAELQILSVLWRLGPSTVRQVHESLPGEVRYTTVLKQLQLMAEKGLATRDAQSRAHLYSSSIPEESTQRRILSDLLDKAFGGSSKKLVAALLCSRKTSADELEEIQQLIDDVRRHGTVEIPPTAPAKNYLRQGHLNSNAKGSKS